MTSEACHWIGGEWRREGALGQSSNPATGDPIGQYFDASAEVVEQAIQAASVAFETTDWRDDPFLRATALSHLADAYEANLAEVIDTLSRENGKLVGESTFEASLIPRALRFAAGLAMHNFGRVAGTRPGQQSISIRQAVGVAGLIIPWNGPTYLMTRALAPALAAGCTAVIKMPHQAAQTAALAARIIASVEDIPRGVVNIFTESGAEGAKRLVESPLVPVISFTGSTATGRVIPQAAGAQLKRVGLELGGKTPHLVFDDAQLDGVIPVLVASSTVFAGQFCMTGSRILVQRGVADEVRTRLAAALGAVRPGPASDPASEMGPLIDKPSVARVDELVQAAIAAGAKVIVRGGPCKDPKLASGAFYMPTLLEVMDASLSIVRDETFGPVQTLQVFDTEEEAIALANDSDYGLSACIWSRDVDRPIRVARRLQAGLISINSWANVAVESEEGGWKGSGSGRLGGLGSMEDFLEYKQITQDFIPRGH
jgi:betaine-aldehyde dehydrogenase